MPFEYNDHLIHLTIHEDPFSITLVCHPFATTFHASAHHDFALSLEHFLSGPQVLSGNYLDQALSYLAHNDLFLSQFCEYRFPLTCFVGCSPSHILFYEIQRERFFTMSDFSDLPQDEQLYFAKKERKARSLLFETLRQGNDLYILNSSIEQSLEKNKARYIALRKTKTDSIDLVESMRDLNASIEDSLCRLISAYPGVGHLIAAYQLSRAFSWMTATSSPCLLTKAGMFSNSSELMISNSCQRYMQQAILSLLDEATPLKSSNQKLLHHLYQDPDYQFLLGTDELVVQHSQEGSSAFFTLNPDVLQRIYSQVCGAENQKSLETCSRPSLRPRQRILTAVELR